MDEKSNKNGKVKIAAYLSDNGEKMLSAVLQLTGKSPTRGRSEAIEEAIKFYFGYLTGQTNMDFLCGVYGKQVEAYVTRAADRITSQLFKQAVEINMLTRIAAADYDLSKDEYDKMRSKAVAAVKQSAGRVTLFDTVQDSNNDL